MSAKRSLDYFNWVRQQLRTCQVLPACRDDKILSEGMPMAKATQREALTLQEGTFFNVQWLYQKV